MNKIYIGNLPFQVTQADLENLFHQFGEIKEVAMIQDRFTNKFKGFAFITFADQQSAQQALSLDGHDFSGRPMKVSIAREMEKRSGGGGGGRRSGGRSGGGRFGGGRSGDSRGSRGNW